MLCYKRGLPLIQCTPMPMWIFHPLWFSIVFIGAVFYHPRLSISQAFAKGSCGKGGPLGVTTGKFTDGAYKIAVPSSLSEKNPMPIMISLHGDANTYDLVFPDWESLWEEKKSFILVAPNSPYSFSWWQLEPKKNAAWLESFIDHLLSSYNIDTDRMYLQGWSGGTEFIPRYLANMYLTRKHPFAGALYCFGGANIAHTPEGECKIAAYFIQGEKDSLRVGARALYDAYIEKGHAAKWVELPGVGHQPPFDVVPGLIRTAWEFLSAHALCNKTTTGACGSVLPGNPDQGNGARRDAASNRDGGLQPAIEDMQSISPAETGSRPPPRVSNTTELTGNCAISSYDETSPPFALLIVGLGYGWLRRYRLRTQKSCRVSAPQRTAPPPSIPPSTKNNR